MDGEWQCRTEKHKTESYAHFFKTEQGIAIAITGNAFCANLIAVPCNSKIFEK